MIAQIPRTETPDDAAELLAAFRALSDPRRFHVMRALMRAELCVCEVIDELGVTQSLASHHLGVLRRAGLIRGRRDAQWVYYSVNPEKLRVLARAFGALFDPEHLGPSARYGARVSCAGIDPDLKAGRCCARHEHRPPRGPVSAPT